MFELCLERVEIQIRDGSLCQCIGHFATFPTPAQNDKLCVCAEAEMSPN